MQINNLIGRAAASFTPSPLSLKHFVNALKKENNPKRSLRHDKNDPTYLRN